MPRAVLGFSLFSLAVNMGLVRAMLTGLINTDGVQIPLVSFLAETVCRGNCVIGIVAIAILWGLEVFLDSRLLFRVCEIKSNDFTSSMSGAARFVWGNSTAIKVLSVISLVAGFGIEIVKRGKVTFKAADSIVSFAMEIPLNEKTLQNTADSVIPLVAGNAFFFVIPLLVVSFAMWLGSGSNKE